MGENAFQIVFMLLSELDVFDKVLDWFKSCKNGILSSEWVFSEEDLEGGFLFMLILNKIWIWASKLVKIVVEEIDRSDIFWEVHWSFFLEFLLIISVRKIKLIYNALRRNQNFNIYWFDSDKFWLFLVKSILNNRLFPMAPLKILVQNKNRNDKFKT